MNIVLNDESFRYDVHSLIKSFYPEEELNYNIISRNIPGTTPIIDFGNELSILIPKELAAHRTNAKNVFKRKLYDILSNRTKKTLPWGTLTGIRPIKIPTKLLSEGKTEEEIHDYLIETYYVSKEKRDLAISIAKREQKLLSGINMDKTASLYIGIPFCPSICAYCSFSSYPLKQYEDRVWEYLYALKKELEAVANKLNKDIITIYIGGGTPTTLNPEQLRWIIDVIKNSFNLSELREFSVECGRPDSITEDKLNVLMDMGVGRISINPQTMNDKTLNLIGRRHSSDDIIKAFELAKSAGVPIINCDLIAGLPSEGIDEVKYTLNKIEELKPNNITVHSLAIKRAADFNLNNTWSKYKSEITDEIMNLFFDTANRLDISPYYLYRQKQISGNLENIGFAAKGVECLYNSLIMGEYHDIIACGAGAVSKFTNDDNKPERVSNVKDVDIYISRIDEMIERKIKWL